VLKNIVSKQREPSACKSIGAPKSTTEYNSSSLFHNDNKRTGEIFQELHIVTPQTDACAEFKEYYRKQPAFHLYNFNKKE
jgi:hypothetical protein